MLNLTSVDDYSHNSATFMEKQMLHQISLGESAADKQQMLRQMCVILYWQAMAEKWLVGEEKLIFDNLLFEGIFNLIASLHISVHW